MVVISYAEQILKLVLRYYDPYYIDCIRTRISLLI